MKKIVLFLCCSIVLCCETPSKKKPRATIKPEAASKPEVDIQGPPKKEAVVVTEKKPEKTDNTLIQLQRKPCSGDCPVFEVSITKDSLLIYKGVANTNVTGTDSLKLSADQYDKLSDIIKESQFDALNDRYTTSGTSDFPETTITFNGKKVAVRLWKDAPDRLTDIYVFIEDILYDQKYLE